jgi:hypothetical protein
MAAGLRRRRTCVRFGPRSVPSRVEPWQWTQPVEAKSSAPRRAESEEALVGVGANIADANTAAARDTPTDNATWFQEVRGFDTLLDYRPPRGAGLMEVAAAAEVEVVWLLPRGSKSWTCQGTDSCAISRCCRRYSSA